MSSVVGIAFDSIPIAEMDETAVVGASVSWITVAPVKGLALVARDEVVVEAYGVADNRRLHLVDDAGRLVNGKRLGGLVQVVPDLDVAAGRLSLSFPDGNVVAGALEPGEQIITHFYGRPVTGRIVGGELAASLSSFAGEPLRMVLPDDAGAGVDRGGDGAVTLLGTASLERLAGVAGVGKVDPRRFRMLFGVDGIGVHEEDTWIGRDVAVGEAVIRVRGNVGRCAVTTQNPDTGVRDLATLEALTAYRGVMETTEPLPFGVVGSVVTPGRVALGDAVAPAV